MDKAVPKEESRLSIINHRVTGSLNNLSLYLQRFQRILDEAGGATPQTDESRTNSEAEGKFEYLEFRISALDKMLLELEYHLDRLEGLI